MKISVIILTKNEEANIKECIGSILDLDCEIIIFDDHSNDKTCEIAQNLGARVEKVPDGMVGFGEKRRYVTKLASEDVVLHLDSDERLTPKLIKQIEQCIDSLQENEVVEIPRLTYLFNKPVRHCGWYPDYKRRIYNRKHTDFSEALVHEDVVIKKNTLLKKLQAPILHYSYPTLESFYKKQALYPVLWGQEKTKRHKTTSLISIPFRAFFFFLKTYVLRLGVLDGKIGLWLSIANMNYECSKYLCLYELQERNHDTKSS